MNPKFNIKKFLSYFVFAFIANVMVVYLWDFFLQGQGTLNFGLSATLALAIGIVFTLIDTK